MRIAFNYIPDLALDADEKELPPEQEGVRLKARRAMRLRNPSESPWPPHAKGEKAQLLESTRLCVGLRRRSIQSGAFFS